MNNMKLQFIFLFTLLGLIFSCENNNEEDLYGQSSVICDTVNISFSEKIAPLFESKCATVGCHVQGNQKPVLENYEQIKQNINKIENRVLVRKNMPPAQALNTCDQQILDAWIKQGTKNN